VDREGPLSEGAATPLADVVAASDAATATSSRTAKAEALAALLARLRADEVEPVIGWLTGEARQGRIGIGWATVAKLESAPAAEPSLTVADLDTALDQVAVTTGSGSVARRNAILQGLLQRATAAETDFLRRLLIGELRQGALEGVMVDAIARASEVPATVVRRAHMLGGRLGPTARLALFDGRAALEAVGLEVGRAVRPMLASTAPNVADAMAELAPASVEWKLDGARIQVHRRGDEVVVFTRNLNDVTSRLPEVVEAARALPVESVVLDGETLMMDEEGRPRSFQDSMSRFGADEERTASSGEVVLRPWFFDVLHVDGEDLLDLPLRERLARLDAIAPALRIPGRVTDDPAEAVAIQTEALDAGHEGVMVKAADSPYQAGRRGKAWRKVKPVHTLDLVVLAVEWGSGRRRGWLSNLHLGARDPDGGFVMVGKTFKGLTDALLTWQTEQLLARETSRDRHVVHVRPELVVEIALDGVQRSTRYPGGVALRFARVVRYREDKDPAEADLISTVQAMLP
jgi:DNA ligase-1